MFPGIISRVGISNSTATCINDFRDHKLCQHLSQITYNYSHVSRSLLDNDLKSWKFLRLVKRVTSCEKTQSGALVLRDWSIHCQNVWWSYCILRLFSPCSAMFSGKNPLGSSPKHVPTILKHSSEACSQY